MDAILYGKVVSTSDWDAWETWGRDGDTAGAPPGANGPRPLRTQVWSPVAEKRRGHYQGLGRIQLGYRGPSGHLHSTKLKKVRGIIQNLPTLIHAWLRSLWDNLLPVLELWARFFAATMLIKSWTQVTSAHFLTLLGTPLRKLSLLFMATQKTARSVHSQPQKRSLQVSLLFTLVPNVKWFTISAHFCNLLFN